MPTDIGSTRLSGTRPHPAARDAVWWEGRLCGHVTLHPGQRMASVSCGGGGYGIPHQRDVRRVLKDVSAGWVSTERARDVYGVVVRDGGVDLEETKRLRTAGT